MVRDPTPPDREEDPRGPGSTDAASRQVTRLLRDWREGDEAAGERLMAALYEELHRIAEARMRKEAPGHTLQSTALIHEAYLRLAGAGIPWTDRTHFFAVAARTMRRILTDHARARQSRKRGGALDRVTLSGIPSGGPDPDPVDLLALDAAIEDLARQDPRKASAVELHYYGGLSYEEIAGTLDISPATVHRDLRLARAWLRDRLEGPAR